VSFDIRRKHCVHEGGTKFYQVITVSGNGRSVCMTHWGKYPGNIPTPAQQGESKLETYESLVGAHEDGMGKQREKMRRGYKKWKEDAVSSLEGKPLLSWLATTFGTMKGQEAYTFLTAGALPAAVPDAPVTKKEPAEPKTKTTNTSWGSW
jgi:hypothetical protein